MRPSPPRRLIPWLILALVIGISGSAPAQAATGTAPTATDDAYTIGVGGTLTVGAPGVLGNDTGGSLSAQLVTGVSMGALTLNPDGSFTYGPNTGFHGTDTFTYEASDGTSNSNTATVTITVDDPPTAADDTYGPLRGGSRLVPVKSTGVLRNDSDPNPWDAGRLQAILGTGPTLGHLDLNADGSFSYQSNPGVCNQTDRFTYAATDGALTSALATVTISLVTPLRDTTLTLTRSANHVVFGHSVLLTANLSGFSPSAIVSIYGTRADGTWNLLGRGSPDDNGDLQFRVKPSQNTTYMARSADNCFHSARSPWQIVGVAPRIEGHMVGSFARKAGYALYHAGGRAPLYRATVAPDHAGRPVLFVWQRRTADGWKMYYAPDSPLHLGRRSTIAVYLTGGVVRNQRYRVRIVFLADRDHLARAAPWARFVAI